MIDLGHEQFHVLFGTSAFGDVADVALDDGTVALIIEVGDDFNFMLCAAQTFDW